jgi:hypothetical protein
MAKMNIDDIPQITPSGEYRAVTEWTYLEEKTLKDIQEHRLQLEPDFQRGHVWKKQQQITFVEYCLKGGTYHRDILLNNPGWMSDFEGDYVLVDGLQRLTAIRKFITNTLTVFDGIYLQDFDRPTTLLRRQSINWCVNKLKTRAEVLQWYLDLNTGGIVHSDDEIKRVQNLLKKEQS